ncbi:type I-F CRISPR-associated protein Csy2 [Alphaproteobacteria bacterium]|nr:type I-F CRISPR-associated protein Csy2 [Alphaproteobacteria bacterium]
MTTLPSSLLVLPHLRVQNANAISSPMTHGFPSITSFLGLMWALQRRLGDSHPIQLQSVAVICHGFEEQTTDSGYTRAFKLTRNPLDKDGGMAAIVEEGRIHLEITLVFGMKDDVLDLEKEKRDLLAHDMADIVSSMRIAGGVILPNSEKQWRTTPSIEIIDENIEEAERQFRKWRRSWLPGFALVSRDDLLQRRLQKLREANLTATALDAWLDLSRFNWAPVSVTEIDSKTGEAKPSKIEWRNDHDEDREGWIVPIPVGYGALSEIYPPGDVANARDMTTPFRFVESLYSVGQWISPHRLQNMQQLLWYNHADPENGLYRAKKRLSALSCSIGNSSCPTFRPLLFSPLSVSSILPMRFFTPATGT